jgi:hypothetical protein
LAGASALGVGSELIPSEALERRQATRIKELAHRFLRFVQEARQTLALPQESTVKTKTDFRSFHRRGG